ncbi:MAG: hypothetical protein CUR32_06635 [Flavobacterium sp.]|nr:MAG: hypothetical protein CUR32_06635 [Flavobacterium sp.] [Flavobacterium sp. FEMGT703F]
MFGKKRIIIINQSDAKIGIDRVENLNVSQIGGTINNGVKSTEQSQQSAQTGKGKSIAIGYQMNDETSQDLNDLFDDIFGDD